MSLIRSRIFVQIDFGNVHFCHNQFTTFSIIYCATESSLSIYLGCVEKWLQELENQMIGTLQMMMVSGKEAYANMKRKTSMQDYPTQVNTLLEAFPGF